LNFSELILLVKYKNTQTSRAEVWLKFYPKIAAR
jgi:hypothetical protein